MKVIFILIWIGKIKTIEINELVEIKGQIIKRRTKKRNIKGKVDHLF